MSSPGNHALDLAIGFGLGVFSSVLASAIYDKMMAPKRRREEQLKTLQLFMVWQQGVGSADQLAKIDGEVGEIRKHVSGMGKARAIAEIQRRTDEAYQRFLAHASGWAEAGAAADAILYKKVADLWSDQIPLTDLPAMVDEVGRITSERIRAAHRAMFPRGYVWAGQLRQSVVMLQGSFVASGSNFSASASSMQTGTMEPRKVGEALERLVSEWNAQVMPLQDASQDETAMTLAKFHHDFELIHPFIDGNGRIGRALLDQQCRFLFARGIGDRMSRIGYLSALRQADFGGLQPLATIILNAVTSMD